METMQITFSDDEIRQILEDAAMKQLNNTKNYRVLKDKTQITGFNVRGNSMRLRLKDVSVTLECELEDETTLV